jgi:hypothetical protein
LQVKEHVPPEHTAVALVTLVVQASPQPPQFVRSCDVFVHPPLQRDGADAGHPDEQT